MGASFRAPATMSKSRGAVPGARALPPPRYVVRVARVRPVFLEHRTGCARGASHHGAAPSAASSLLEIQAVFHRRVRGAQKRSDEHPLHPRPPRGAIHPRVNLFGALVVSSLVCASCGTPAPAPPATVDAGTDRSEER